ncbi:hypothetical protein Pmani_013188 [Petrolisthes manimaculis]|uniref:Uncharacterized protein n=1 Tax=Petrolisthes manimaculis TaxID=1843537 RepID=A0AAE1PY11_9EUCA|nr:hypothetical protein Pmani_013188 [Petrolisthes manimaculis]
MVLEILSSKENIMEPDQNPASWPDPEDQRMEHDGHIDPQPLIPSTKDIGIQLQVNSRKRTSAGRCNEQHRWSRRGGQDEEN